MRKFIVFILSLFCLHGYVYAGAVVEFDVFNVYNPQMPLLMNSVVTFSTEKFLVNNPKCKPGSKSGSYLCEFMLPPKKITVSASKFKSVTFDYDSSKKKYIVCLGAVYSYLSDDASCKQSFGTTVAKSVGGGKKSGVTEKSESEQGNVNPDKSNNVKSTVTSKDNGGKKSSVTEKSESEQGNVNTDKSNNVKSTVTSKDNGGKKSGVTEKSESEQGNVNTDKSNKVKSTAISKDNSGKKSAVTGNAESGQGNVGYGQKNSNESIKISVSGVVIDSKTHETLPGANIVISGTSPLKGTASDGDGKWTLSDVDWSDNIVVSYVGYASQTLNVAKIIDAENVIISLIPSAITLPTVNITAESKCTETGGTLDKNGYKCICPDGLVQSNDGKSCEKNVVTDGGLVQCVSDIMNLVKYDGEKVVILLTNYGSLTQDQALSISENWVYDAEKIKLYNTENINQSFVHDACDVLARIRKFLSSNTGSVVITSNFDVRHIENTVKKLDELFSGVDETVWKNADGEFNTARLASDSIAGVVLGTVGGVVTSNIVKKNQVKNGFESVKCAIGGKEIANFGDEFNVNISK